MPKKAPKPQDFNGPAKPLSAYFLYGNEIRPAVMEKMRAEKGADFKITMLGSEIASQWKSVDQAKKQELSAKAVELKKEYEIKQKAWKASEDFMKFRKAEAEFKQKKNAKTAKAELAAAGCPKKAQTARFAFQAKVLSEVMRELKEAGKDLSMVNRSAAVTAKWNALSAEEKKVYEDQAVEARKAYDVAMTAFKQSEQWQSHSQKQLEEKKNTLRKLAEDAGMPKHPGDAAHHHHMEQKQNAVAAMQAEGADWKNTKVVNEKLRAMWTALDDTAKKVYEDNAAAALTDYEEKMTQFKKTDEYKKYARVAGIRKRRLSASASSKKDAGEPSRKKRKVDEEQSEPAAEESPEDENDDDAAGDEDGDGEEAPEEDDEAEDDDDEE